MYDDEPRSDENAMPNFKTDPELIRSIRDISNQIKWLEFVEFYSPLLLKVIRGQLGRIGKYRDDEAHDLVQDVLTRVMRNIGRFEYDPQKSFRRWLKTIATNRANRFFRENGRRPTPPGGTSNVLALQELGCVSDEPGQMEVDDERDWRRRCLEVAVKHVRPTVHKKTWQAFELRFVHNKPYPEIASELDMEVGAVYTSISRVLKKIREAKEKFDE
jgi:RNA polymerase sigma-70 factor (ECF subfamily)